MVRSSPNANNQGLHLIMVVMRTSHFQEIPVELMVEG